MMRVIPFRYGLCDANVNKEITFAGQTNPTLSLSDNANVGDNFSVTLNAAVR